MTSILIYLIFPGFLFTALAGMMASWLDRKITARIQWRVGPPWFQSFADILKLLSKETVAPRGCSRTTFLLAPVMGFAATILASSILWTDNFKMGGGFVGDVIVTLYLLAVPALAMILGGSASGNPLAAIGAGREMKLMIAYELPFLLAVVTVILKTGLLLNLGEMVRYQRLHGSLLWNPSCVLSFAAAVLCVHAKLGLTPFDIAEAETEINGGPLIEYAGPMLAVFKLTRMMLLVVAPVFLLTLFTGGMSFSGWGSAVSLINYLLLLLLLIVIRNTNPRLRIDQALKFFWGPVTVLAVAGIVLAAAGY